MVISVTAAARRRLWQRECPMCGHLMMVPPSKLFESITCECCDYRTPARKTAA